jgi:hypothetical protein
MLRVEAPNFGLSVAKFKRAPVQVWISTPTSYTTQRILHYGKMEPLELSSVERLLSQ